jgi:hypothetical protein
MHSVNETQAQPQPATNGHHDLSPEDLAELERNRVFLRAADPANQPPETEEADAPPEYSGPAFHRSAPDTQSRRDGPDLRVVPRRESPPTPQALEAEQSTLGAMIIEGAAISKVLETLTEADFYREIHRKIFGVIVSIFETGEPVDLITVAEEARRRAQLDDIGGPEYLTALIEACPSAANVEAYARPVKETSQRRAAIVYAETLTTAAHSGEPDQLWAALSRAEELREEAAAAKKPRFALQSVADIEEQPARPQVVKGILPADSLAAIVGPYATFKSFVALDLALSVATGRDWHGHETQRAPVVYIAAEGSGELGKRLQAWRARHQCERPANLHFITEAVQLMGGDAEALARELAKLPERPGLVVIDTLARCMVGGDENHQKDMGLFIAGADKIRRATGAAVLTIHHDNKEGGTRGSTSFPGAVDTLIKTKATGDKCVRLSCDKQKDAAPFEPVNLIGRVVELSPGCSSLIFDADDAPPEYSDAPRAGERDANRQTLLDALNAAPDGLRASEWQRVCDGVPKRTFYRHRDALEAAGDVVKHDEKYYSKSPPKQTEIEVVPFGAITVPFNQMAPAERVVPQVVPFGATPP